MEKDLEKESSNPGLTKPAGIILRYTRLELMKPIFSLNTTTSNYGSMSREPGGQAGIPTQLTRLVPDLNTCIKISIHSCGICKET